MTSLGHTSVTSDNTVIVIVTNHKTYKRMMSYNVYNAC